MTVNKPKEESGLIDAKLRVSKASFEALGLIALAYQETCVRIGLEWKGDYEHKDLLEEALSIGTDIMIKKLSLDFEADHLESLIPNYSDLIKKIDTNIQETIKLLDEKYQGVDQQQGEESK